MSAGSADLLHLFRRVEAGKALAWCGARSNENVVLELADVTCPECLALWKVKT